MRKGAEWLQEYMKNKPRRDVIVVGGNFPVQWYFRNDKAYKFIYLPYQKRSDYDWDYAIIANSYISPTQLKNKTWPPSNTIHTITVDGIPVCAVIERLTKDDLEGLRELEKGNNIKSALLLQKAIDTDPQNEWICYKFAELLANQNLNDQAVKMFEKCLSINPEFEPALVILGNRSLIGNDNQKAAMYFEKAIVANRKYFNAYVQLASVYASTNVDQARKVLKDCLSINPHYKPALQGMADTYRKSAPNVAKRYDELINTLK
jgi:tetratricopeptide (TPR) repeat protein